MVDSLPKGRVHSIDALRGFDMFWIIGGDMLFRAIFKLMDNPVGHTLYEQLEHKSWNGFAAYDLIFPLFMFLAGLSMPFSITKRLDRGDSRTGLYKHILIRSATLFAFGLIYNGILNFQFANMRWPGVLQRIALGYLFAALIVMNTKIRGQVIWTAGILLAYFAAMKFIPVPGYGAGVLTPEGNLASYVDRLLVPGRFCCFEFGDNEGLLSTIPAISTVLLGVLSGHWLRSDTNDMRKFKGLVVAGVMLLAAGIVWGSLFPINKLLWSSSFVLYAGGWSILLLALFYYVIDIKGIRAWSFPFTVIGLNSITIYMASRVIDFHGITRFFMTGTAELLGAGGPVAIAICLLTLKWIFLYFLYRHKIFLRV